MATMDDLLAAMEAVQQALYVLTLIVCFGIGVALWYCVLKFWRGFW